MFCLALVAAAASAAFSYTPVDGVVAEATGGLSFVPAGSAVAEGCSPAFSYPEGGTVMAVADSDSFAYFPAGSVVAATDSASFSFDFVQEATVKGVTWSYMRMNGAVTIVGARGFSGDECEIPASLDGYPVKSIGHSAFAGCLDLVAVVVPQSVTNIAESAFADCTVLESVELTEFVTGIGAAAFSGCINLVSVNLPDGLDSILPKTFAGCASLEQIAIPNSVRLLGEEAFAGCGKLRIGTLPRALELIEARAFADCGSLDRLAFPAGLGEIGKDAFVGCTGLSSVTFAGQPPVGIRESGLVDKRIALHGPAGVLIDPADGAVFDIDLQVSLSTTWPNGVVRYTLDGSEPTVESSSDSSFLIHGKTTVRAATFVDGLRWGEIVDATYGVGKIRTPEIESKGGDVFSHNGKVVTIACQTRNVEIRYTLNGSVPTKDSSLYVGPFEISRTTTVRAKAFGHPDYVDSDVSTRQFVREWEGLATPSVSPAGGLIEAACERVTIACESAGATIYYTLDGTKPSATNGRVYKGPFELYQSAEVKAVATKYDWADSEVASVTFTRKDRLGEALNCYGVTVANDSNAPWTVDATESHDGVNSVRSSSVENGVSGIRLTVKGAGRLTFWWKASCEEPWEGEYCDYGSFKVGSEEKNRITGQTDWQNVVVDFETTGKHTLHWDYVKDGDNDEGKDCIWIDQVVWIPADGSGKTLTSAVSIPYAWLASYGLGLGGDFETAANAKTGKRTGFGRELTVCDDYVAGTNPTNVNSVFTAIIDFVNGKPCISWRPNLNEGRNEPIRAYKVLGAKSLEGEWLEVDGNEERFNFFTVTIEMPDNPSPFDILR